MPLFSFTHSFLAWGFARCPWHAAECKYTRNKNEAVSHNRTPNTQPGVIQYQCCSFMSRPK